MMKRIILTILFVLAVPLGIFAATKSADFERDSTQWLSRADNVPLSLTNTGTWEAWVKMENLPIGVAGNYGIMGKSDTSGLQDSYNFTIRGSDGYNALEMFVTGSPTSATRIARMCNYLNDATLYDEQWIHVAATYADDGTIGFFLNGVAATSTCSTSGTATNINDSTSAFSIGADYAGLGYWLDGNVYLARVWSTVRTESEINTNKCTVLGATTGLEGEWELDDALTDTSGNGLDLTNNDTVVFSADVPSQCAAAVGSPPSFDTSIISGD